jgi:type 1 glutamine amidotransferase
MRKRFSLPTFLCGTAVLVLFGFAGITWAKANAPLFRAFGVYSKASDHAVMIARAVPYIQQMATANNFTVDFTSDTSLINNANLAKYQLFIQLQLGPMEFSAAQEVAFENFINAGKGWVGIHGAGLITPDYFLPGMVYWQWYQDFLGGVQYSPHPAYQKGTIIMEDRTHPATKNMPATFQIWDEWYEFNKSPRPNVRVLGRADESTYTQNKPMGDHPMIWTNEHNNYRMIYICTGHDSSSFGNSAWTTLLHDAIMWAGVIPTAVKAPGASALWSPLMKDVTVRVDRNFVAVDAPKVGSIAVTLTDANGRMICRTTGSAGTCRIDRRVIMPGVYFVNVSGGRAIITQKVCLE